MSITILNRVVAAIAVNGMLLTSISVPVAAQEKQADQGQRQSGGGKTQPPSEAEQRQSQERQQQRVEQDQQRQTQFHGQQAEQQRVTQQRTTQLQTEKRPAQSRFQQQFATRAQQVRVQDDRSFTTNRQSYLRADSNFRYSRGGVQYETNQYGATMLRQGVNFGYEEGFRSGQADKQDRWASNYQNAFGYQDASFGYSGHYVDQTEYAYYFREGFRRGYEDGYSNRHQYGSYTNGKYSVLATVLTGILVLDAIR